MQAQCKMEFPLSGVVGPNPPFMILVDHNPTYVTAFINIGPCPEGIYAWHPRVYLHFIGTNASQSDWYNYPGAGDQNTYTCFT
jgi:hypothetical protein